jgi:signal transduction histidine kinase
MLARRRLPLLFLTALLAPALGLALAAFYGLKQERVRAEQEFRARAQADATEVEARLEEWMTRLAAGLEPPPAGGVTVEVVEGLVRWRPSGALAYDPGAEPLPVPAPGALERAQVLELREERHAAALAAYREARAQWPQWSLFLQARLLKRAGRMAEARAAWRELAGMPETRLGSLPSQFLARFELGGDTRLLDELEGGRWALSRTQFFYYREALGGARRPAGAAVRLTNAVADFLREPKRRNADGTLAWWIHSPEGLRAVLLPAGVFRKSVWPRVWREGLQVSDDGRVSPLPVSPPALAAFDRQQRWLQGLLLLLLVAGGAGGYLLYRLMRREMEIAAMQADFVAAVSHEFRSPLAGIRQLVHLLDRDRVPDEQRRREYYAMMGRECTRLTRLVENVLDFSRLETGKKEYRMESVDVASLLREVAEDLRVEVAIGPELPWLHADREALVSAIRNLLDNAAKYAGGGRLEAEARGKRIVIRVCDDGPGIAPEDRKMIFEKFYRASGDSTRRVKGVGLGLALVKRIVEAHGGTVRVESELGKGTVFTLELEGVL